MKKGRHSQGPPTQREHQDQFDLVRWRMFLLIMAGDEGLQHW